MKRKTLVITMIAFAAIACMSEASAGETSLGLGWNEFSGGPSGSDALFSYRPTSAWNIGTYELEAGHIHAPGYGSTNFGAISYIVVDRRLFTGIGVAYVTKELQPRITSNWNFYLTTGIQLTESWSFSFHHISNAGTKGQNFGENIFAISYSWE